MERPADGGRGVKTSLVAMIFIQHQHPHAQRPTAVLRTLPQNQCSVVYEFEDSIRGASGRMQPSIEGK
jgi:hypothetical protein